MPVYQGFNTLLFQLRVVSAALLVLLNLASAKNVQIHLAPKIKQ